MASPISSFYPRPRNPEGARVEKLFLTVACGDYDRTKPLQDGSVEPEGIKLNYVALQSEEIFWRMGHYREFDASDSPLRADTHLLSY